MKLHQLRAVIAIAEHGSLRAAARRLGAGQPALTRSLAELERELGTPLFHRGTRGMVLTKVGSAFMQRANAIVNEMRRASEEAKQLEGGISGNVVAGLSISAHILMLPSALRPFYARYPDVQLHIIEGLYPAMEQGLKVGGVDFYIGPRPEQKAPAGLVEEILFVNTRTILCRKGHPLAGARSLKDLAEAEWLTMSITARVEEEFKELFAHHELPPPRLRLRSQSALTLITSLAYSDLLAMVPVQWLESILTSNILQQIRIREALPAPPIVMIRRRDLPLTPAASYLVDLFRRRIPRMKG
jgi:LysR family transcriptional regulator, regulator of abg operon